MRRRGVRAVGKWHLWIYEARWRLAVDGRRVTGSSSQKQMRQALSMLEGQLLSGARVELRSGATTLSFDLGAELQIRRWRRTDTEDLWILYEPDDLALAVTADGRMSHQSAREVAAYMALEDKTRQIT